MCQKKLIGRAADVSSSSSSLLALSPQRISNLSVRSYLRGSSTCIHGVRHGIAPSSRLTCLLHSKWCPFEVLGGEILWVPSRSSVPLRLGDGGMVRVGNGEEAEWISVASLRNRGVHPWLSPSTLASTVAATMILFSLYCNRDPHELLMHCGERGILKQTMFVKVHMEGYRVGRKIDVKAHDSYDSLSHALRKMFHNFLSNGYNAYNPEEHNNLNDFDNDFVLLFEDHDGVRMLVADVPWKLFINTVKRLYIVNNPNTPSSAEKKTEKVATSSN